MKTLAYMGHTKNCPWVFRNKKGSVQCTSCESAWGRRRMICVCVFFNMFSLSSFFKKGSKNSHECLVVRWNGYFPIFLLGDPMLLSYWAEFRESAVDVSFKTLWSSHRNTVVIQPLVCVYLFICVLSNYRPALVVWLLFQCFKPVIAKWSYAAFSS